MSITLKIERNANFTHIDKHVKEDERLKEIFEVVDYSPWNSLCNYVSLLKLNRPLTYELEQELHEASLQAEKEHLFDVSRLLKLVSRKLNQVLQERSSKLSGHEVTSRRHIVTNPGGKRFSHHMDSWGDSIYRSGQTYQQLVDEIISQVNASFSEEDIELSL